MSGYFSILNGLKRISENEIGAIDGAAPYLAKFDGSIPLSDVLSGKTEHWYWRSLSASEAESADIIIIMFLKHMDVYTESFFNSLKNPDKRVRIDAYVHGLMINSFLFLNSRYPTTDFNFEFWTHDEVTIKHRGITGDNFFVRGYFNLSACSYYCNFDGG